jgi:hypothetical protein
VAEGVQPETPLLLPPPLLLPALVVPPLLLPFPVLFPLPLLLPPSVRPPSTAVQTPFTQLPVQQSTSDVQVLPRPAPAPVGTQLWQSDEVVHPVGQTMSPQLPPVPIEPPLLHAAAIRPERMENKTG